MKRNEFEKAVPFSLIECIQYADKAIVSKQMLKKETGNISLFAFDKEEELSEHTAPFDATVMILNGKAEVVIDGSSTILEEGETIIMPANIPHALRAVEKFKMILIMIKD